MGLIIALARGWGESKIKLEFNSIQWKLYLAMFHSKHQIIKSEDKERDEI